ncbi:MAG: homoserine dehydrogenase [Actinomycetota bacterium]|nr:homoserine dehydrogenase [Actinomycetota bacterium]
MSTSPVRVGVLGCGNVGAALVRLLADEGQTIAARTGVILEVARVAVRDVTRPRPEGLADGCLSDDAEAVVTDPAIDVVVEVIGGVEPARELVLAALKSGKPVVTANKELLADAGAELFEAAAASGVDLLYEASVAGAIPLVRLLRESLAGEHITRVMGIVNGTTNYILTRMTEDGASYAEALSEAQGLGYAERDPTADVEGFDAAAKAAIVASIAFGTRVVAGDVHREGISNVSSDDITVARRLGYVVKLLAIAERVEHEVAVRVHPAMVPVGHPLATVRDSFNAIFIEGEAVGELMLYGRGAGGKPTASAVLGDLVDAAHNLRAGGSGRTAALDRAGVRPIDELSSEYYLNIDVVDRPGVLARVATVFGEHGVSIRSMEQEGLGEAARLVFITHTARERDVRATLRDLRRLDVVKHIGSMLRVVGP